MTRPLVLTERLERAHPGADGPVRILHDVSLSIAPGEFVAIMGPSGSGKSTLLQLLGCLDTPNAGEYWLDGIRVSALTEPEVATLRNRDIGFVFQSFNLLPRLTVLQNIELPLLYAGLAPRLRAIQAQQVLEELGLGSRGHAYPTQLSGGQQQLVAIARALVSRPKFLLADEPTGNLDRATGARVLDIMERLYRAGMTIVLVTHDSGVAARSARTLRMNDGTLEP